MANPAEHRVSPGFFMSHFGASHSCCQWQKKPWLALKRLMYILVFDPQHLVEQRIRSLAHFIRKIVVAIGVLDHQSLRVSVQPKDTAGRFGHAINARGLEICVTQRRNDQRVPGRESSDHFRKIKRNLLQASAVLSETRHVSR